MKPILVIDDDFDLASTLAGTLSDLGYEATYSTNGAEALARLEEGPRPAVIVLDLMMPRMNGWEVCASLSANPELERIPVVVMTAASLGSPPPRHARICLKKPFELEALIDAIEAALTETVEAAA